MSNPISGAVSIAASLSQTVGPNTTLLQAISIPLQETQTHGYSSGTAAQSIQKAAVLATTTTGGAPYDVDLTTMICLDNSVGFTHVRERLILNGDPANTLATGNDGVVTTPFCPTLTGTTPVVTIQPGAVDVISKPLGTTGWATAGATKVRIDGGSHAVPFILIVLGD